MNDLDFYAVVTVLPSPDNAQLGVQGSTGVVVGRSESQEGPLYAVLIADRTVMVRGSELVPTGEILPEDAIYTGHSIKVSPERYPTEKGDPIPD